jgi:hypothetical protein
MTVELAQLRGEREKEKSGKKIIKNLPYQKIIYIPRRETNR